MKANMLNKRIVMLVLQNSQPGFYKHLFVVGAIIET